MDIHCDSFHSENIEEGRNELVSFLVGFFRSNQKCHFFYIIETFGEGCICNLIVESAVIIIGALGYIEYLNAIIYDRR